MRILLIDKSDSELIPQALKQERIPFDRMQPSEFDDSIVIPEDIYDAAILTASDIAYSRGARTCERITALREENAGQPCDEDDRLLQDDTQLFGWLLVGAFLWDKEVVAHDRAE